MELDDQPMEQTLAQAKEAFNFEKKLTISF